MTPRIIIIIAICIIFIFAIVSIILRNNEYGQVMRIFNNGSNRPSSTRRSHRKHSEYQRDPHQDEYSYLMSLLHCNENGLQRILAPLMEEYRLIPGRRPSPCRFAVIKSTEKLKSRLINSHDRYLYQNLRAISLQYLDGVNPRQINKSLTYYQNGSNSHRK